MGMGREVPISLDGVRDKNLMQLKKLNTALFPVRYNEKYYADVLASGEFTKLGLILLLSTSRSYTCFSSFPHHAFFVSFFFCSFIIPSCVFLMLLILPTIFLDLATSYLGR